MLRLVIKIHHCGNVNNCDNCDVSMTFHKTDNMFHCHYCKNIKPITKNCYLCKSENLIFLGTGTQKVETIFEHEFRWRIKYDGGIAFSQNE